MEILITLNMKQARSAGRRATASIAAGQMSRHLTELETLFGEALG
jgi:2-oxoglutarate dehydrogenase complex dehydrogenase (E1) component-like enzyme